MPKRLGAVGLHAVVDLDFALIEALVDRSVYDRFSPRQLAMGPSPGDMEELG